MNKYTKEQIEDLIVMKAGNLTQDLITAIGIVKDSGMDMKDPIASLSMNFVLAEVRRIRAELENPYDESQFGRAFGIHLPIISNSGDKNG